MSSIKQPGDFAPTSEPRTDASTSRGSLGHLLRANVKTHGRRYVATGLAVAISTAFIMVFLALGNGMTASLTASARDSYQGAAAVVEATDEFYNAGHSDLLEVTDQLKATDGVTAIAPQQMAFLNLSNGAKRTVRMASATQPEPFHRSEVTEGALPNSDTEIFLNTTAANNLGVKVGDTIQASAAYTQDASAPKTSLTVSGLVKTGPTSRDVAIMTPDGLVAASNHSQHTTRILVASSSASPSIAEQEKLANTLTTTLNDTGLTVTTGHAAYERDLKQLAVGLAALTAIFLIFPVISMIVAIIVVATTFQVIMTQRRRELALLRAIGATKKQTRSLVMREAALIGLISSAVGTTVGALGGFAILNGFGIVSFSDAVASAASPIALAGTWAAGTLMTIAANLRPARSIARMSPIEALGNQAETASSQKSHRVFFIVSLIIATLAFAGMGVGLSMRGSTSGFLVAFLSGMVALVAMMCASIVFIPALARLWGSLGRGTTSKLARENTVRNPGRTAATGVAIAIGVTLITMMSVGAASMRQTLTSEVDSARPYDLTVQSASGELPASALSEVTGTQGVAAAVEIHGTSGTMTAGTDSLDVFIAGVPDLNPVAHSTVDVLDDSTAKFSSSTVKTGDTVQVCTSNGKCADFTALIDERSPADYVSISANALGKLDSSAGVSTIQVKLDDQASATEVQSALLSLNDQYSVNGTALERETYNRAIDQVLLVVIGMLGISVLIALVGVTNTLSLSVAERTRENGLLRALGMTRRNIKTMLSVEAVCIALAGSTIGVILGIIFGIAGTYAMPLEDVTIAIVMPWGTLIAVVAVSVLAALIASWLPGRKAAKVSPVEALATE